MEEYYIGQIFKGEYPPEAAIWCNKNDAYLDYDKEQNQYEIKKSIHIITIETYDNIMEQHLYQERVDRGYTKREPSEYAESTVERWAQDAQDWIKHRDEVMIYGLEVENHYKETGEAPTIEEFKANLPIIHWTYDLAE